YIEDLNHLPFPARRSSSYKRYSSVLAQRSPITVAITSRGCPFNCIFCNRMGRRYRCHSAEYVLAEFEDIARLGIGEVFIYDDVFTLHRERIEAICRGLITRRHDLIWQARTRVDLVDEAMLALMRKSGCQRLSFGVESGSEKVLKSMRKNIDLNRVEKVFSWCRREGIATLADFMIGNLDETAEDVEKTIALMKRINPDYVQFSICCPYPGTPLYDLARERGVVTGDIWRDFAKNPLREFRSPVWTEYFSEEELIRMTAKAYRSFYLRPMFILKQIRKINSFQQLKTMAAGAISMMIKRAG
ncbi:MAG: radical SAM protein, partial [Kiritimatiellia bacterium]|nr:radical SAM protein [Kiritimatiellia bacterium]